MLLYYSYILFESWTYFCMININERVEMVNSEPVTTDDMTVSLKPGKSWKNQGNDLCLKNIWVKAPHLGKSEKISGKLGHLRSSMNRFPKFV